MGIFDIFKKGFKSKPINTNTITNINANVNANSNVNSKNKTKENAIEVLNFWKTIEFLNQVDKYIVKEAQVKDTKKNKLETFKNIDNTSYFQTNKIEEMLTPTADYKVIGNEIQYVVGEINRNDLVTFFQQFAPKGKALPELSYPKNSTIAVFSFKTSLDGVYVKYSLSISPLIWAGYVWGNKKNHNQIFNLDLEDYKNIIKTLDEDLEEKNISEFFQTLYDDIFKKYVASLSIPLKNNYVGFCNVNFYKSEQDKEHDKHTSSYCDLGRSYFAEDINLIIESMQKDDFAKTSKYEQEMINYILAPYKKSQDIVDVNRTLISTNKGENLDMQNFFTDILNVNNAPLGKWPSKFMPVLMQQVAVNIAISKNKDVPIFSVNGPPGTGKTTLLKEIVANNIVQRAILLAEVENPDDAFVTKNFEFGPLEHINNSYYQNAPNYYAFKNDAINDFGMLVTSSNNSAVENITVDLPNGKDILGGLEYSDDEKENIKIGLDEVAKLFNPEKSDDVEVFNRKNSQDSYSDIYFTRYANKLLESNNSWGLVSAPLGKNEKINDYCFHVLNRFLLDYKTDIQIAEHKVKYIEIRTLFLKQLAFVKNFQAEIIRVANNPTDDKKVTLIDAEFMDMYFSKDEKISTNAQVTNPYFTQRYNREREKLFYYACKLHKEFILSSEKIKHNIINILISWGKYQYCKEKMQSKDKLKAMPVLMQTLFLITPVISTTFASTQNLFRYVQKGNVFGTLIVDEAGQALPQMVLGAMFRCRQAIIVGDPKQIEPVVTAECDLIKQAIISTLISPYKVKELSVQGLADYINPYGTFLSEEKERVWVGCPLTVHRRCIDPMYSISNQLSYDGTMKQQTGKPNEKISKTFILDESCWIDVKGSELGNKNHFVPTQGDVVVTLLEEKFKKIAANDLPALYIITPFKSIKTSVIQYIKKSKLYKTEPRVISWIESNNIGTVHTFQGKGTDEVIFLLGCDKSAQGAIEWVNKNIVNVAATRAKFRFYIIGDKDIWGEKCKSVQTAREITNKIISFEELTASLNPAKSQTQTTLLEVEQKVPTPTQNKHSPVQTPKVEKTTPSPKPAPTPANNNDLGKCEICNSKLRIVNGPYGEFISCVNYKKCGAKGKKIPKT